MTHLHQVDVLRPARITGAVVPGKARPEHLDPARLERRHHLLRAGHPAGEVRDHVEVIAVVETGVRVVLPDEHRVDAAVPRLDVIQVPGVITQ